MATAEHTPTVTQTPTTSPEVTPTATAPPTVKPPETPTPETKYVFLPFVQKPAGQEAQATETKIKVRKVKLTKGIKKVDSEGKITEDGEGEEVTFYTPQNQEN